MVDIMTFKSNIDKLKPTFVDIVNENNIAQEVSVILGYDIIHATSIDMIIVFILGNYINTIPKIKQSMKNLYGRYMSNQCLFLFNETEYADFIFYSHNFFGLYNRSCELRRMHDIFKHYKSASLDLL